MAQLDRDLNTELCCILMQNSDEKPVLNINPPAKRLRERPRKTQATPKKAKRFEIALVSKEYLWATIGIYRYANVLLFRGTKEDYILSLYKDSSNKATQLENKAIGKMSISLFTYLSKKILKNMVLDIFEGESDKESLLWFLSKVTINARKVVSCPLSKEIFCKNLIAEEFDFNVNALDSYFGSASNSIFEENSDESDQENEKSSKINTLKKYPYLKSLVIQCRKVNYQNIADVYQLEEDPASTFQFISKDFLDRFPKMANLKIHIANQTPTTYDDERGQVTLMYEVMRITKNAEEILRRVEKNKPEMTVSFEIYGRTPPTDGYEMRESDYQKIRKAFAEHGFKEKIEDDDVETLYPNYIDFVKREEISATKKLVGFYYMHSYAL